MKKLTLSSNPTEQLQAIYPTLVDGDFYDRIIFEEDPDTGDNFIKKWNHPTLTPPTQKRLNDTSDAGDLIKLKKRQGEALPAALMAVFETLPKATRKKWYKNGTKGAIREALQDGELEAARGIVAEADLNGPEEQAAQTDMLGLFDEILSP